MKLNPYGEGCNLAGPQVRTLRMERGLSQEQLAAKLQLQGYSIGQKAVSRMETGDRVVTDYELVLLAQALGVSPLRLLER
ncbi:MAG: helix-turn-helix transcriptional regulator [Oscillibacter sp.]|nr:helix-turn-helix transcriptional regulator [Oscillibacter sp.]